MHFSIFFAVFSILFISAILPANGRPDHHDSWSPSRRSLATYDTSDAEACAYISSAHEQAVFDTVSATLVVPDVGGSDGSSITSWVSLMSQGNACPGAMLAAGVLINIDELGSLTYQAGWSLYQGDGTVLNQTFSESYMNISPGDHIQLLVTAFESSQTGFAGIKNLNTSASQVFPAQPGIAFCGQTAWWGFRVVSTPLIDFNSLIFTDAKASGLGNTYDLTTASMSANMTTHINDYEWMGTTVTSTSFVGSDITIQYTGQ